MIALVPNVDNFPISGSMSQLSVVEVSLYLHNSISTKVSTSLVHRKFLKRDNAPLSAPIQYSTGEVQPNNTEKNLTTRKLKKN